MYRPSSPSSVGPVVLVPPFRSVWSRSHGGVGWGLGGSIYGYIHGPSTNGGHDMSIFVFIFMYYIYGPAALIFIYVCIYMGRRHQGCLRVRLRPWMFHMFVLTWDAAVLNGSSQIVHFKLLIFLQIWLRGDFTHTHTTPSGPLDLFEFLTCLVWPRVKDARCYLGFGKVGLKRLHPSAPRSHPSGHDKHVREPLVLSYATLGLFIYLFI